MISVHQKEYQPQSPKLAQSMRRAPLVLWWGTISMPARSLATNSLIKTASLPTVSDQIGLGRGAHELLGIRLSNQAPWAEEMPRWDDNLHFKTATTQMISNYFLQTPNQVCRAFPTRLIVLGLWFGQIANGGECKILFWIIWAIHLLILLFFLISLHTCLDQGRVWAQSRRGAI